MTVLATIILGLLAFTAILNSGPQVPSVQAVPVSVSVNLGNPKTDRPVANGPKQDLAESINVNIQLGDQKEQQKQEEEDSDDTATSSTTTTTPEPVTTTKASRANLAPKLPPNLKDFGETIDNVRAKFAKEEVAKMKKKLFGSHEDDNSGEDKDDEDEEVNQKHTPGYWVRDCEHPLAPLGFVSIGGPKPPCNPKPNEEGHKELKTRFFQKRSAVEENPVSQNSTNQTPVSQNSTAPISMSQNSTILPPVIQNSTTLTPLTPKPATSAQGFISRFIDLSRKLLSALFDKIQAIYGWRPKFLDFFLGQDKKPGTVTLKVNGSSAEIWALNSTAEPQISANGTSPTILPTSGLLPQELYFENEIEDYGNGRVAINWPSKPFHSQLPPPSGPNSTNSSSPNPPPLVGDKLDNHL